MKTIHDYQGLAVRLTDERLPHILEHPEMVGMESAIEQTIVHPNQVVESISDSAARLYYRFYMGTMVGDKYLDNYRFAWWSKSWARRLSCSPPISLIE